MKKVRALGSFLKVKLGKPVPLTVRALLTTKCNLSCPHCKVYKRGGGEMSTERWLKAIDILDNLGTVSLTFQGGEPLLRKDLPDILKYSYKKMFTNITTNGVLLKERLYEISDKIDSLTLSIDSFFDTNYGKSLNEDLLDLVKKTSEKDNFSVQTVCVLNRKNIHEVEELIKKSSDYGFLSRINLIHSDINSDKWMFRGYSPLRYFGICKR
jgi:MoaA/NifB/PqqE/SkfB family radical SAM enzyme